jgi:hypothetical protein
MKRFYMAIRVVDIYFLTGLFFISEGGTKLEVQVQLLEVPVNKEFQK